MLIRFRPAPEVPDPEAVASRLAEIAVPSASFVLFTSRNAAPRVLAALKRAGFVEAATLVKS